MAAAIAAVPTERRTLTHSERIAQFATLFERDYPRLLRQVEALQTNIWPTALADACKYQSNKLKETMQERVATYLKMQALDNEVLALTTYARFVLKRSNSFPRYTPEEREYLRDAGVPINLTARHISTMEACCLTPLQSLFDLAQGLRAQSLQRLSLCQDSFNESLQHAYEKLEKPLSWTELAQRVIGTRVYLARALLNTPPTPPQKPLETLQDLPKISVKAEIGKLNDLSNELTQLVNKLKPNKHD